jgi:hypothetical protein
VIREYQQKLVKISEKSREDHFEPVPGPTDFNSRTVNSLKRLLKSKIMYRPAATFLTS